MESIKVSVLAMLPRDWPQVRAIYLEGVATGNATFAQTAPDWDTWDAEHLPAARLAAHAAQQLVGWAALSRVSTRTVYAGVAEVSIYVAERARGRGVGRQLLQRLVLESEAAGIWTLQAGIFPDNAASVALHQRAGFRLVGRRERLGQMNGRWRDVLLLERRSQIIGR